MFDHVIFDGYDQTTILMELVRSGYIGYGDPEIDRALGLKHHSFIEEYQFIQDKEVAYKNLQMFLLADSVMLPYVGPDYQMSDLGALGIRYALLEENEQNKLELDSRWKVPVLDELYAQYIKPVIIDTLVRVDSTFFYPKEDPILSAHQCYEIAYNAFYQLPGRDHDADIELYLRLKKDAMRLKEGKHKEVRRIMRLTVEEQWDMMLSGSFRTYIESLTNLLEMSANSNAMVIDDSFDFSLIAPFQPYLSEKPMEAYGLLRARYGDIIGELPHLESIRDVVELKQHRANDIKRLRSVLNEFEEVLRSDGREACVVRITRDLQKASQELAKGNPVRKVTNWLQYCSVPVSVAEMLLSAKPVVGLSLQAICQLPKLQEAYKGWKYNWIKVVR